MVSIHVRQWSLFRGPEMAVQAKAAQLNFEIGNNVVGIKSGLQASSIQSGCNIRRFGIERKGLLK